ncbi:MAG TPA: hypothetical protein VE553_05540, partial [Candidatus Binatia bacterium]|nr:hypothetical protein [Candidatus Binatia bacterium]
MGRQLEQRRRAEEQNVQRNIQLQGRLQLSQQLARHMSLEERLGIVVNGVSATLPAAQAASLWLYDLTGKQLQPRAWSGYDGDPLLVDRFSSLANLARDVCESGE